MAVQDRIERFKREKMGDSTEELGRLGWVGHEEARGDLEARHDGEYVMIELERGILRGEDL